MSKTKMAKKSTDRGASNGMKILLATPLFPPDIGGAAPYVKELARRLAEENHDVTVLTYGHLPEQVRGVSFVCVHKKHPLPFRLVRYTFTLFKTALRNEIIYAQNGASVELPTLLLKLFLKTPLVIHIGDYAAHEYAGRHVFIRNIERFAFQQAYKTITDSPKKRPEILPFKPYPKKAFDEYNASWREHIEMLHTIFKHAS